MSLAAIKKVMGGMLALFVLLTMSACGMNHNEAEDPGSQAPVETDDGSSSEAPVKNTFTEEEKALIESQEGVTVDEDGVIQVDVSGMFE